MDLPEHFTSREWRIDQRIGELMRLVVRGEESRRDWQEIHELIAERARRMMPWAWK